MEPIQGDRIVNGKSIPKVIAAGNEFGSGYIIGSPGSTRSITLWR